MNEQENGVELSVNSIFHTIEVCFDFDQSLSINEHINWILDFNYELDFLADEDIFHNKLIIILYTYKLEGEKLHLQVWKHLMAT